MLWKPVPWLKFTPIDFRLVLVDADIAIRPAQVEIRSQRVNNRLAVYFGLNRDSFRCAWHGEIQSLAESHWVGSAYHIADHGVNHLRLHQECSGIRPVACRHREQT